MIRTFQIANSAYFWDPNFSLRVRTNGDDLLNDIIIVPAGRYEVRGNVALVGHLDQRPIITAAEPVHTNLTAKTLPTIFGEVRWFRACRSLATLTALRSPVLAQFVAWIWFMMS